ADARYFVENAPDALYMAGEWYLDRKTHTVTYWPVAGENMPAEQVIAPALVQLVRLEGKPEAGEFVRNVTFRGLQVAHAGGYAIAFGRGSKRNQVQACELFDLGGGGIKLGEAGQSPNDNLQNYE